MRKLAPAVLLTSIVALSSGAAFAFGDMNKSKKSSTAETATSSTAAPGHDCKSLKPTDPAWTQNKCDSIATDSAATSAAQKKSNALGGGEGSGAAAGSSGSGSSAAGSGSASK